MALINIADRSARALPPMRPLSPRERKPLSRLSKRRGWDEGDGDRLCA